MKLTGKQKKYLKRHLQRDSIKKISTYLNIPEKELLQVLKANYPERYKKIVPGSEPSLPSSTSGFNFKIWLKSNYRQLTFLVLLVFLAYANSLGNDFVSDDIPAIRDNPLINNFKYLTYFGSNPKVIIIFFTHKLFDFNPVFFRLSNILFHLGVCWLVYLLLSFFFPSPIPFFTASIFAVHPILTESVTWISGGPYSNSTFFVLLSLLGYIIAKERKKTSFYVLSIFSFLIAFLFNTKTIAFPAIVFLYEFCLRSLKKNWFRVFPFFILGALGVFYLMGQLEGRVSSLETTFYQEPGLQNPFLVIPVAISSYLQLSLWPKGLTLYHSEMAFSGPQFFLKVMIFLIFLVLLVYSFKKNRSLFFWLSFFIISLAPTLTPFKIAWVVAERYVYLGTIGIFVLIAIVLKKIGDITKRGNVSYVLLGVVLVSLLMRTIIRNTDWKNQDTLWLATAKTSPSSPQNHNNLGDLYVRQGDLEKAAEEFQLAIKLKPNYGDAYHNLANVYQQMGKEELAIENYQQALSINPDLWQPYQNLAAIYFKQGKMALAKENLEKAIEINSNNAALYTNLGIIYLKLGRKDEAKIAIRKALEIDPGNKNAKQILIGL